MKCEGLIPDPRWSVMESGVYFLTWQEGSILSAHFVSSSSDRSILCADEHAQQQPSRPEVASTWSYIISDLQLRVMQLSR